MFCPAKSQYNIIYKHAPEWMGHRSSDIFDLYYTMFDNTKTIECTSNKPDADSTAVKNQADPATA